MTRSRYPIRVRGVWALPLAAVCVAGKIAALTWRMEARGASGPIHEEDPKRKRGDEPT